MAETPGQDGALTVSTAGTILNDYVALSGGLSAGQTSVNAGSLASTLAAGDLVLVYQAQGATIDQTNSTQYGTVTNLGGAGQYEFQTVASVSGSTVTFATYDGTCSGLRNSYGTGRAQMLRVPQYTDLTITNSGEVIAPSWNGQTGGVAAIHVRDTLRVDGQINLSGLGFRGGALDNNTTGIRESVIADFRTASSSRGAEKGESIAGFQADYSSGRYGRGAPANGGGGGNAHNAGGGGGANGDNGDIWQGYGVPNNQPTNWFRAWDIDGALTSATRNSGGGRGGYTFAGFTDTIPDPFTVPPGNSAYGGDYRDNVGGLGGRPLTFIAERQAYFGGGGGAGDANNNSGGRGGNGGGLVIIVANTVTGNGTIAANGENGANTMNTQNDAPGGGGGGGTIMLSAESLSGVALSASGGKGGDQFITNSESEGPGGGGGGGVISVSGGTVANRVGDGGANGLTNSSYMTAFRANGATQGAAGQPDLTLPALSALPFCLRPPGKLSATKSVTLADGSSGAYALPGEDVIYSFEVTNTGQGPVDSGSFDLSDVLPPELEFLNTDFGSQASPVEFTAGASGLSCCTGTGEVLYSETPAGPLNYTPIAGYDPNVSRISLRPSGEMVGQTTVRFRFRARIK